MQILPDVSEIPLEDDYLNLRDPLRTRLDAYQNGFKQIGDIHRHSVAEFGLCRSGNGVFFIGEQVVPFYRGFVTYMPSGVPHIAQSPKGLPSEWLFLFADAACFGQIAPPKEGVALWDEQAATLLSMIMREQENVSDDGVYYRALLDAFFARLSHVQPQNKPGGDLYRYRQIMPAINYISKEYASPIDAAQLAELCHMSPSLFFRSFHSGVGMSPIAYLHAVRLSAAEALLRSTDEGIADIACRVGYPTTSSFYRQFVRKHGISPREYRCHHQNDAAFAEALPL